MPAFYTARVPGRNERPSAKLAPRTPPRIARRTVRGRGRTSLLTASPTPKREPRQAREGATVARKGVAGPSSISAAETARCAQSAPEAAGERWRPGQVSAKAMGRGWRIRAPPKASDRAVFVDSREKGALLTVSRGSALASIVRAPHSPEIARDALRRLRPHSDDLTAPRLSARRRRAAAVRARLAARARDGRESSFRPWPRTSSSSVVTSEKPASRSSKTASSPSCTSSEKGTPAPGASGTSSSGRSPASCPGLQAAFIDVGQERAAFLHVEDLDPARRLRDVPRRRAQARHERERGRARREPTPRK